jgi:hypothetical protein
MKKLLRMLSILGLEVILLSSLMPNTAEAFPLKILDFQLGGIGVYPSFGPSSWFGQAAWTPSLNLGIIGIRGELGFTAPENAAGTRFLATNIEGYAQFTLLPFITLEAGGGAHDWTGGNGGTNPALSGGVAVGLGGGIDRIYATVSHIFLNSGVNEYKIGLGFNL